MRSLRIGSAVTDRVIPTTKIGETEVPRLILGHLPFVGESYQGKVKNAEYSRRFSKIGNIVTILTEALEQGITVVSAPTPDEGDRALQYLEAVREASRETGLELALIVCLRIPLLIDEKPIDDYRRWLTYYQVEKAYGEDDVLRRYLRDPILQAREGWESKFPEQLKHSKPYSNELARIEIDYRKIVGALATLSSMNVTFIELGSETDLLAIGGRLDLLDNMVELLRRCRYRCLLGSHHAGTTMPILERSKIAFDGYVTPVNKIGVMMFPTKEACEASIRKSGKPVIAIKPFAGGRIHPQQALEYVYRDLALPACMIGVGSEDELRQDLSAALNILRGQPK
ncbi:hypothetical protein KEJ39_00355 [Candidatus Bathyarchaeota archaeon]|nr:hypothetical protein [Candidatus Bathyarchaeota archaeon]